MRGFERLMNRPGSMRCVFLAIALAFGVVVGATERPNLVIILADDLGYGDVGAYGGEVIQTPYIDALAHGGALFEAGYVSHPVCSPSRAGLVTGRYQQRHGWEFNPAGRDANHGLSLDEETIADHLKRAGYRTGLVGKWHLGIQSAYRPLARGFDEFFGILEGGSTFIDSSVPGVEYWGRRLTTRRNIVWDDERPVEVSAYLTDVFTERSVRFIEEHASEHGDEPFFLFLSHTTPHTPLQATARYAERYRHIEDDAKRVYAAMVASLDDSVGAVRAALERTGVLDDTLIVFLSDNGCAGYVSGACSNRPLRGFKRYHHEGGIRVPFVMHWPDGIEPQRVTAPVSSLDILDTFLAAAGADEVSDDSVDLLPFLDGRSTDHPHEYLYWRSGPTSAIRDDRYKLVEYKKTDLGPDDLDATGRLVPPDGAWPIEADESELFVALYDLQSDPGERVNLVKRRPGVVDRLRTAHRRWAGTLGDPIILPYRSTLAEFDGVTVQLLF